MRKFVLFVSIVLLVSSLTVGAVSASPDIESCDSGGYTKDTFSPGEPVYLKGSGLEPMSDYLVYIVIDHEPWVRFPHPGYTNFGDLTVVVGPLPAHTDMHGNFVGQPLLIWDSAAPGYYDIWADCLTTPPGTVGLIDAYDAYDDLDNLDVDTAGFFVIPEVPLGSIAMLLACFTGLVIKRRKLF